MNRNDNAIKGLAWLAATMPTLIQQDCIRGDELTDVSAHGWGVKVQLNDYYAAVRIAARLALAVHGELSTSALNGREYESKDWRGYDDGLEVTVAYCARIHVPTECMDEVSA